LQNPPEKENAHPFECEEAGTVKTCAAEARRFSMVELAFFGGPNHFFSRFPGSRIGAAGDTFSCLRHNGIILAGTPRSQ
jgi:hypothetical protein